MSLMPSCKDITEHSSEYLDKNLPLMKRLSFHMHMFMCVNCRRYVNQIKLTIATIGKTEQAKPKPVDEKQVQEIVQFIQSHRDEKN